MSTISISKSRIRRILSTPRCYAAWRVEFDNAREGRLVDGDNGTVYYWDIDPNGWLCVCAPATWEGAGPLHACAWLGAKRIKWHYM